MYDFCPTVNPFSNMTTSAQEEKTSPTLFCNLARGRETMSRKGEVVGIVIGVLDALAMVAVGFI